MNQRRELTRRCTALTNEGVACRQAPLEAREYCFWHDPDNAGEAAEARRLGGLRRKRERTLGEAYDLLELNSVSGLQRLLEITTMDTLSLETSHARVRALIAEVNAGTKLLEISEMNQRLAALEAALQLRRSEIQR